MITKIIFGFAAAAAGAYLISSGPQNGARAQFGSMQEGRPRALYGLLAAAQSAPAPSGPEEGRLIDSLEGQALFREYCAVCHGESGKGDGPMGRALKAPPADLTRIAVRNSGKFPIERVERIISGDTPIEAGHGTREMPLWGPIFSQIAWDQDLGRVRVRNLAKYIEKLQRP